MYKKFIDKDNINNVLNQHHIWSLSIEFSEYLYCFNRQFIYFSAFKR